MSNKLGSCLVYVVGYGLVLLILGAATVGVGVGLGSLVGAIAPNVGPSIFGPVLCPPETNPTLITEYGATYYDSDNVERQEVTQKVQCLDATGRVRAGRGDQYETYWFGSWIALVVLVELLVGAAWLVGRTLSRLRRSTLPQSTA